jgi:hypothetical protein
MAAREKNVTGFATANRELTWENEAGKLRLFGIFKFL